MAKQHSKFVSQAPLASAKELPTRPLVTPPSDSSSIAALAYRLWQERGCPEGSPEVDWLRAEEELSRQSIKPESASTKRPFLTRQVGA